MSSFSPLFNDRDQHLAYFSYFWALITILALNGLGREFGAILQK
jgi:hypothetical protein